MATISIKITGAKELAQKLRHIPLKMEKEILQASTLKSMDEILPEIIEAVPEDVYEQSAASKKYGNTKKNLRVVKAKAGRNRKGARIDTGNAFWQLFYNLGTRYQPARPWLANKFRSVSQKLVDIFAKDVGQELEEMWEAK